MGFYLNKNLVMTPERTEISVTLHGGAPWGFRISGGKEFHQPLVVSRVTPGSVSSKAGIQAGDVVLAIDGEYVSGLRQDQFEEKLAMATDSVMLVIEKNGGPQRGKNTGTASSLGGNMKNQKTVKSGAAQGAMNVQGGERWTIDADNQHNRSFGLPAFFCCSFNGKRRYSTSASESSDGRTRKVYSCPRSV